VSKRRGYIVLWDGTPMRETQGGLVCAHPKPATAEFRGLMAATAYRTLGEARRAIDADATFGEVDRYRIVAVALPTDRARGGR
jgi:hypothetical protein